MASFDEAIPPGQVGKVTASVKTENYRGPVEKTITVTTDDPSGATTTLRVKANVVGSVNVLPRPGLAFPSGIDWSYSGKLLIRKDETEKGELKITDVTTAAPWLIAKARKVEAQEPAAEGLPPSLPGDWVLDVSIAEDAPKGQAGQTVKFKTGLHREPEVTIPVSVVLQTAMRIQPSPLYIQPPQEAGKEVSGTLSAVLRPGLGEVAVKAVASPEPFSVRVEPAGPRRYTATVTWKGAGENPPKDGTVVFRLGDESLTVLVHVGDPKAAMIRPQPQVMPKPAPPATP